MSFENLGNVIDEFEIPYLHPHHHDYPAWPGGDRYIKQVKTGWNTNLVFTQGLSRQDISGGYELYLETPEDIENLGSSWQANLIYEAGKVLPKVNDLMERFEKATYLTLQVEMDGAPDEWSYNGVNRANGNIGLFFGLPNPDFERAGFKPLYRPVNIKLMRPDELAYVVQKKAPGRIELGSFYNNELHPTWSFMERPSAMTENY